VKASDKNRRGAINIGEEESNKDRRGELKSLPNPCKLSLPFSCLNTSEK
jgi:hypothetical protein